MSKEGGITSFLVSWKGASASSSSLEGPGGDALKIGTPVEVFFEDVSDDVALPKLRVASSE